MKAKINIYDFVNAYLSMYDSYINKRTGVIIDEYDYIHQQQKEDFILIPKNIIGSKNQDEIIKEYLSNLDDNLNEIFKNVYQIKFTFSLADSFNCFVEDYGFLVDYLRYENEEYKKIAINWCIDNNYDYYYEEPDYPNEEAFKASLDDRDRIEYYSKKNEERLKKFQNVKKEN